MKIHLNDPRQKREFDKITILHWGHFAFVTVALLMESFHGQIGLFGFVKIVTVLFLYRLYFKTLKNLFYTFWIFSLFLIFYLLTGLTEGLWFFNDAPGPTFCYLLALLVLGLEIYLLNSPVYYPRVNWWEYDFRYRHDLKVYITFKGKQLEGRLTDLRREAGCIVLFDDLEVGESFILIIDDNDDDKKRKKLNVQILSKRDETIGRGIRYGVRFNFDTHEEKVLFNDLKRKKHSNDSSPKRHRRQDN